MSYLYGTDVSSLGGLGCGPACGCAPCRGNLGEWYVRDDDEPAPAKSAAAPSQPAAAANLKGWTGAGFGLGYGRFGAATGFAGIPSIAPAPCPPTSCSPPASFLASTHGFKFPNSFSITVPLPPPLPPISGAYGLCGGMSFAALDYFLSCIPIPSTTSVPATGTPLYRYLFSRLLDSLGHPTYGMVLKFLEWTQRPDGSVPSPIPFSGAVIDGVHKLTVPELHATVRSLSAGNKVPLGLVYVGPLGANIWENHQVLALGATRVSPAVTQIKIYDPNYPSDDTISIRCELYARGTHVRCLQQRGGRPLKVVRGFFRMPYVRRTPPCLP